MSAGAAFVSLLSVASRYPSRRVPLSAGDQTRTAGNIAGVIVEEDMSKGGNAPIPSDFETVARQGYVPGFPTPAQWQSGGKITYSNSVAWDMGPALSTPLSIMSADYAGYSFGFGYAGTGGC